MLLHEARLPRPERSAATRPVDDPQREDAARLRWWRLAAVTLALIALSVSLRSRESASTTSPIVASTPTTSSPATASRTKPIRDIEVGERVLAENPEFEANGRVGSEEPDWSQWLRLSLVMVKADGSELNIELLRSEDWIASHLLLAVQRQTPIGLKDQTSPVIQAAASENVPYSILRPLYQDFIAQQGLLDAAGIATVGCFVELNLPELGVTGVALVRQLRPAPHLSPGTGSVVTATFQHSGGNVIDVIIGNDREHETIGTTDNHPFWSEDQQRYVPAGKLLTGERVRTYLGDTQHIVAVKPRPGPEEVYNLEVHGEHVYYVGRFGTLVHNSRGYAGAGPVVDRGVVLPLNNIRYSMADALSPPVSGTRQTAIDRAWLLEVRLITETGRGTTPWTPRQIEQIAMGTGYKALGFTGHHINRVKDAPAWKGDPRNIMFLRQGSGMSHMRLGHPGGTRAIQPQGLLIDRASMLRSIGGGVVDGPFYGRFDSMIDPYLPLE